MFSHHYRHWISENDHYTFLGISIMIIIIIIVLFLLSLLSSSLLVVLLGRVQSLRISKNVPMSGGGLDLLEK